MRVVFVPVGGGQGEALGGVAIHAACRAGVVHADVHAWGAQAGLALVRVFVCGQPGGKETVQQRRVHTGSCLKSPPRKVIVTGAAGRSNPRFLAASVVAFILGMGLFGSTYLIPLFVQTIQGYMPTESGLLLMPGGLALGLVSPLAGRLADRVAPHVLILAGLALFGWSSLLMADAGTSTGFWQFAGWVVLGRVGLGCILPSLNSGALRVLGPLHVGQGAGAINFTRQLGGAVGVSLLSVYLERQTTLYAAEFNALQTGTHAAADTLDLISSLLGRAGMLDNVAQALRPPEAYRYFMNMLSAQASMMGFRESFFLVALVFFAALAPAWFMRPGRKAARQAARPS